MIDVVNHWCQNQHHVLFALIVNHWWTGSLAMAKKKKQGKKWNEWTFYYYFFFKVLVANNKKTMSSSQQEFLFFDTIVHDGEIEQVTWHILSFEFLFLFSRFFKLMKLNLINQYISMKFVYYQLDIMSMVYPHVLGKIRLIIC